MKIVYTSSLCLLLGCSSGAAAPALGDAPGDGERDAASPPADSGGAVSHEAAATTDAPTEQACATSGDCSTGVCSPSAGDDGTPVGPYTCKPNDGRPYDGCGDGCGDGYCCADDVTSGSRTCQKACAGATCGAGSCQGSSACGSGGAPGVCALVPFIVPPGSSCSIPIGGIGCVTDSNCCSPPATDAGQAVTTCNPHYNVNVPDGGFTMWTQCYAGCIDGGAPDAGGC